MFKIVTLTVFLFFTSGPPDMEEHYNNETWNILLSDVKMRYRFSVDYGTFMQVPRFGESLKELEGQEITLRGFFLPTDVTGDSFVLSHVPMQMCFFCSGAGIETVIELQSLPTHVIRFRRLSTDDFIEVKGTLKLNTDDLDHLIYILEDAAFIGFSD